MHSCSETDIDPCTANTTGNQGGGDFVGSGVINKFLFLLIIINKLAVFYYLLVIYCSINAVVLGIGPELQHC